VQHRVACANPRCGAHRDRTHTTHCSVCGTIPYIPVSPVAGDIPELLHGALALWLQLAAVLPSPAVIDVLAEMDGLVLKHAPTGGHA
jgi:hypothetical protein